MSEEVVKKAKALGRALKESEEYIEYVKAQKALDDDKEVQDLLKEYDDKAKEIQLKQMTGESIDEDMVNLQNLEKKIMDSEIMGNYTRAEKKFKELVDTANRAIVEAMEAVMETEEEEKE